ncbi:MAG: murein biosynthesis integral membrane protein MurJ [Nitrospiraceae bacterium]|nr:murein biosynthesis integral membrane protein MurJ [Nitrospiraceae bacterium]
MSHKIAKAAGVMSVATLISRILGFVRDMVMAFYLGATGLSDAFYVGFRIPNLLRDFFAEGSMSSAFVPVLSEYHAKEGNEGANRLVKVVFAFILTVVGSISIIGILGAPAIVGLLAPGFLHIPGKFALAVMLTRIMFPFLLFVSLSALAMGSLNTRGIFFIPALAPAVLNVVMITIALLFARINAPLAAAFGILIGGMTQFLFQLPSFFRAGYSLRPVLAFKDPGLRKIMGLVLPATFAMSVAQINVAVSTILASYLSAGSITYLYYAMRLIHFPIGIFGVSMGLAVLPALSAHFAKGDIISLRNDFSFALRLLFFWGLPSMAGLIALRKPIISTLFFLHRGKFDYTALTATSAAVLFYAVGLWAMVGVRVLNATFYAMQDTRKPVISAVAALIVNIILSIILLGPLKYKGLALANSLASCLNFTLLSYMLRKKLGRIDGRRILKSIARTALASLAMGIAGYEALKSGLWNTPGHNFLKAGMLFGGITLCGFVYIIISFALKSGELEYAKGVFKRKFARLSGAK